MGLEESDEKEIVKASEIVVEALQTVPDHQFKLYHRLEYFVDQLLVKSLQKKKLAAVKF